MKSFIGKLKTNLGKLKDYLRMFKIQEPVRLQCTRWFVPSLWRPLWPESLTISKEKTLLHFGATHVYMNVGLNVCYYFNVFFCVYIFGTQTLIGAAVVFLYVIVVVKFFLLFLCLSVHWEAMFEDMQTITQNLTDG